jgi:hypothetical protein
MVQVASVWPPARLRGGESRVCHVTAVGRLAETAVGGPQRVGDMYQNPAVCLRLIEDVGMYKSIRLRTKESGTPEVVAFLSEADSVGRDPHQRRLGGTLLTRSLTDSHKGGYSWQRRTPRHTIR